MNSVTDSGAPLQCGFTIKVVVNRAYFFGRSHSKFTASFGSPLPLYFAACGYGHRGRVIFVCVGSWSSNFDATMIETADLLLLLFARQACVHACFADSLISALWSASGWPTMKEPTPALDLLVADDGLHDFDKAPDQREFLRVPIPCDPDPPQRLLPAQFMKPHARHLEALG
jgi:hypothetical protein